MTSLGVPGAAVEPLIDGRSAADLALELSLPLVELHETLGSTLDRAHALGAQGAASGTLVIAREQTAGRGREGRAWVSRPGDGLWLTLLERPADIAAIDVLALRLGMHAAAALERFADGPIRLKWPNDLYVGASKLAGVLVEARWRGTAPEWVAIGFGLNVRAPRSVPGAAGLREGVSLLQALRVVCPALRAAAAASGSLDESELATWRSRDLAAGRNCSQPLKGRVRGISARGELLVESAGRVEAARAGSLVLEDT